MSLIGSTILFIAVDVVYRCVRISDRFPIYSRRGRLIEASLVTAAMMGWGWLVAPVVLNPIWGLGGLAVYGLLLIPTHVVLWLLGRLGRPLFLPLGVSGILFGLTMLLLGGVNVYLLNLPAAAMSEALTTPFVVGNVLSIFAGTYGVVALIDKERNFLKMGRERARIPSGPTSPSSTRNTSASGESEPEQSRGERCCRPRGRVH